MTDNNSPEPKTKEDIQQQNESETPAGLLISRAMPSIADNLIFDKLSGKKRQSEGGRFVYHLT